MGYNYKTITDLLQVHHGISMSVRTLKRRLQSYNLVKRKMNVDEDLVRNIIRSEMQEPGQLAGYRKMWHILRLKHHVHAPRKLVAQILHELDPDASKARKRNKLHRRIYQSHGPSQCWHIDGEILFYKKNKLLIYFHLVHFLMASPVHLCTFMFKASLYIIRLQKCLFKYLYIKKKNTYICALFAEGLFSSKCHSVCVFYVLG